MQLDATLQALSHPLRRQILAQLSGGVTSPKDLAVALGEPLGNVSYHVRMLETPGCIELVRTRQRRGALQHIWRATVRVTIDEGDDRLTITLEANGDR